MNQFPKDSKLDIAGRLASLSVASLIPVVGGPIGVIVAEAYAAHDNRKLEVFFDQVLLRIAKLEEITTEEGLKALLNEPDFIHLLYEAAKVSQRTLQAKKIVMLQNAVVNSRTSNQTLDKQSMFLRYVDELTESHLLLMALLHNPRRFYEENGLEWSDWTMGGKSTLIREAFPDWDTNFVDQLVKDLNSRGLISLTTIHGITSPQAMADSSSTGLGTEFSQYVAPGQDH